MTLARLLARLRKPKPSALEREYRKKGLDVPPLDTKLSQRLLAAHVSKTMETKF